MTSLKKDLETLQKLRMEFMLILSRVESGETYYSAVSTAPTLRTSNYLGKSWQNLLKGVDSGRIQQSEALRTFIQCLDLEIYSLQKNSSSTFQARLQCKILFGLFILMQFLSYFLFPTELQPSLLILGITLSISGVGLFLSLKILKKAQQKHWFLEILGFFRQVSTQLSAGYTLSSAFSLSFEDLKQDVFPKIIWERLTYSKKTFDIQERPECLHKEPKELLDRMTLQFLGAIERSFFSDISVSELLKRFIEEGKRSFESVASENAEKLQWKLMGILFLSQGPALLILLFAPILGQLKNF